jgi:hypothetical protein
LGGHMHPNCDLDQWGVIAAPPTERIEQAQASLGKSSVDLTLSGARNRSQPSEDGYLSIQALGR